MLILWKCMELYTCNLCTFLKIRYSLIHHLLWEKKIWIYFLNCVVVRRVGELLFVIFTDTQRRAAESLYRKWMTIFKCKDYAFYLLPVYYLPGMCFPIMALYLCWFILLTLLDPLHGDRTERRIYNSFRSVVLMKSGKE